MTLALGQIHLCEWIGEHLLASFISTTTEVDKNDKEIFGRCFLLKIYYSFEDIRKIIYHHISIEYY